MAVDGVDRSVHGALRHRDEDARRERAVASPRLRFTVLTVISFHFVTSFREAATAGMASASAVPTAANRPSRMSLIHLAPISPGSSQWSHFPPPGQESNTPQTAMPVRGQTQAFRKQTHPRLEPRAAGQRSPTASPLGRSASTGGTTTVAGTTRRPGLRRCRWSPCRRRHRRRRRRAARAAERPPARTLQRAFSDAAGRELVQARSGQPCGSEWRRRGHDRHCSRRAAARSSPADCPAAATGQAATTGAGEAPPAASSTSGLGLGRRPSICSSTRSIACHSE